MNALLTPEDVELVPLGSHVLAEVGCSCGVIREEIAFVLGDGTSAPTGKPCFIPLYEPPELRAAHQPHVRICWSECNETCIHS